MTENELENFVRRFYDLWNSNDMESVYSMLDEHVVDANAADSEAGREGVRTALEGVRRAFPDHRYTVEEAIVQQGVDRCAVLLTASGTQLGDFFGLPPTNKSATWSEIRLIQLRDGKVVRHRAVVDSMSMLTQLGHVQPPSRSSW
jgi:hypothetical protein